MKTFPLFAKMDEQSLGQVDLGRWPKIYWLLILTFNQFSGSLFSSFNRSEVPVSPIPTPLCSLEAEVGFLAIGLSVWSCSVSRFLWLLSVTTSHPLPCGLPSATYVLSSSLLPIGLYISYSQIGIVEEMKINLRMQLAVLTTRPLTSFLYLRNGRLQWYIF